MFDVVIIGAGVCGAAVARELARYRVRVCVLEKEEDVCAGTSKANSAIVHAGFDAEPGTWKAKMNVEGSRRMEELARELDFPYLRNGSLVVCTDERERAGLEELLERGKKNGVEGLRIVEREELREMEPHISEAAVAALYAPTAAILCPFEMNLAFAENACENGVEFRFSSEVKEIHRIAGEEGYEILTERAGQTEALKSRYVVNAAGVYADVMHNMVSGQKLQITPRRGDYLLLDHSVGSYVSHTIFALPDAYGKGILVTPTVHGNLLVGPTAVDIEDREGVQTTAEGLEQIRLKCQKTVRDVPLRQVITSFAGLRAHEKGNDFILGEAPDAPGFVDCAGIESPGLTSAPAIGVWVAELLRERMGLEENPDFQPVRRGMKKPAQMTIEERNELIRENPAYGTIVCRCEMISEGEIREAIRRPLGARSLDGIKRRTRAGMGRCQAGFCTPRTMEILADELNLPMTELTKCGGNSRILVGKTKEQAVNDSGNTEKGEQAK